MWVQVHLRCFYSSMSSSPCFRQCKICESTERSRPRDVEVFAFNGPRGPQFVGFRNK